MTIVDLTRSLIHNMKVYKDGEYQDPPFLISPWCDIADQSYCVSKLELGTQTGTHIDAPRHFITDGETLDKLPIRNMIGSYLLIDIEGSDNLTIHDKNTKTTFLFLRFHKDSTLSADNFEKLLLRDARVWVLAGKPEITNGQSFEFHQKLARAGKYLVEDLNDEIAMTIQPGGMLIIAPLPLQNVSGSPCRIIVLYQ